MKRFLAMILSVCMLASLLTACGGKTDGDGTNDPAGTGERVVKDSLSVILGGEPTNIDPQNCSQNNGFAIMKQIFQTLVTLNENGEPVPCLAESWEQIDDVTWRFKLRDDVYFHNGEKMTAEDVRYTIERATVTSNSMGMFANFDGEKTAVVDDNTIDIVTKTVFAPIFAYLSMTRAMIVNKKAIEEAGDSALHNPVGTGAFKFVSWNSGTSVTLERNDQYWGDAPAYSNLTFRFVTEAASRAIEIETGNADIAYSPDISDVVRLSSSDTVATQTVPSYGAVSLYINASGSDPVTADVRVRQAMAYALNVEDIVYGTYGDLGIVPVGVCSSGFSSTVPLDLFEYNPEKAKELLAEAGYSESNPAKLTFYVYAGNETNPMAEMCQNYWTAVGFDVEYVQGDWASLSPIVKNYEGSVWICAWSYAVDDFGFFINDFDPNYTGNFTYAYDERIAELKARGAEETDPEQRKAIYAEAQKVLYNDDVASINLGDRSTSYLLSKNVEGFEGDGAGCPYLGNVVVYEN